MLSVVYIFLAFESVLLLLMNHSWIKYCGYLAFLSHQHACMQSTILC